MENQNAINVMNLTDVIDPKDAEIKNLREQVESADAAATRKSLELDAVLSPLFSALEPRIDALIESRVGDLIETAMNDFDIYQYQGDIDDMINERLPEGLDDESRTDDLKAAIVEILPTLNLSLSVD